MDYEKFAIYSIITHSTAIEGSTLTEQETELLFENGLTAKGKPLLHHLMNMDLRDAYMFAMEQAKEKPAFSPDFLKKLNALVMKSTGSAYSTLGGNFDAGKGDFRLLEDRAEYIASLRESQDSNDCSNFLKFMALEHLKTLKAVIN